MNALQFITYLADSLGCEPNQVKEYVDVTVAWMTDQVSDNGSLTIPNFGRFEVTKQMEYVRVDAASRKRFLVPPSLSLTFLPAPLVTGEDATPKNVFIPIKEALLAQAKIDKYVAEQFPVSFFKGILDVMESGEKVDVPLLGSFMLTKLRVAENIYGKVSFSPDNTLSEHLNRPFAFFSEVELNDGVEFKDISTINPYDSAREEDADDNTFLILSDPVAREEEPADSTPEEEPANSTPEEEPADSTPEEEPADSTPEEEPAIGMIEAEPADSTPEEEPADNTSDSEPADHVLETESTETSSSSHQRFWIYTLPIAALVIGLVSLLLHLRHQDAPIEQPVAVEDTVDKGKSELVQEKMAIEDHSAAVPGDAIDFAAMNAQIPYGAYDIVGIDTVITVAPGQDLATISRIFLGTDIHIYLVVANDGNANPKEGDKYRIPRLQLRK